MSVAATPGAAVTPGPPIIQADGAPARILHVHKIGGVGGSERHLLTLLPRLDRRRYRSSLLALADPQQDIRPHLAPFAEAGVETTLLSIRGDVDPRCLRALVRHLRAGRFDLVHTHLIHGDLYGAVAARLAGVPHVVSTRHNDDAFRHNHAIRLLTRLGNGPCSQVIAISSHVADFVERLEAVPRARLRIIHYGVPPSGSPPDNRRQVRALLGVGEETPLVVSVGRLVTQKGHRHLVEAWRSVKAGAPEARLFIVGNGPLRASLEADVRRLGLQGHVVFTGFRHDVSAVLDAADLYVHPSQWEGFGLTLLEAMAEGKSVVASRVSAIPEIVVDGQTGLLVPAGNPLALAEAILRLLRDSPLREAMGQAGRRRAVREFTIERMVRATEAVYEEVMRG